MEDVLFLITARSGSKGILNKNIKQLGGKPLLAYRIQTALKLTDKKNVWLSTDSEEYAQIGKQYGATVPFIRPEQLAKDDASSIDVVLHAMQYAESKGYKYSKIALLEPTSPFVYFEYIKKAIQKLNQTPKANAIVATKKTEVNTFFIQEDKAYLDVFSNRINDEKALRRQDFKDEITPSGGFYIANWNAFKCSKSFYTEKTLSFVLPEVCALEIDYPEQFLWAEFLIDKKIINVDRI